MSKDVLFIAVDFDGTVVRHEYPKVGPTVPGAVEVLKRLVVSGHQIILYTMRSGQYLQDAIDWYEENGIPLASINVNPTQKEWTDSPKAYAKIYIDDAAIGCPLLMDVSLHDDGKMKPMGRPFVNWDEVAKILELKEII